MPELPEVQTVVDTLRPKLLGRKITRVVLNRQDIVTPSDVDLAARLAGRTISDISRRGKRIIFTLDTGERFYIHLGMSGRLGIEKSSELQARHTHLLMSVGPGTEVRFVDPRRFGGVWWVGDHEKPDGAMGPEPLLTRPSQLAKRLSRTTRAIKNALLDQTVLAGLGNIYADESLFAAGIHPLTPANKLSARQVGRLSRAIKSTLRKALRHRGSTLRDYRDADGTPGGFQKLHRVYDRKGKPCRKCRTPIERIVLGGRSTHFCPTCQPQ
ncbi:MAG TPA: bifunctional DNA-formamidopyrimidine glycosylase/DNA-(apurinic or apyrimidinic site) lyase [Tepidisphaeraceae bacterium]|nr:bifunctional DNA-formamidopyrimidine glycosylase/DNA-(apurinic or apyrimidinic site) lyase [Tepidisphaeraceae bacterium]